MELQKGGCTLPSVWEKSCLVNIKAAPELLHNWRRGLEIILRHPGPRLSRPKASVSRVQAAPCHRDYSVEECARHIVLLGRCRNVHTVEIVGFLR